MNKALLVGETTFQGRKAGENTKKTEEPDDICPLQNNSGQSEGDGASMYPAAYADAEM
jgi:hypothetical protein